MQDIAGDKEMTVTAQTLSLWHSQSSWGDDLSQESDNAEWAGLGQGTPGSCGSPDRMPDPARRSGRLPGGGGF